MKVDLRLELVDFARADQGGRIGARQRLDGALGHARARGGGQDRQFFQGFFGADQERGGL